MERADIADGAEVRRRRRMKWELAYGTFRLGPDKRFARCDTCGAIDYVTGIEANEGDRHACVDYGRRVARVVTELCDIENELGIEFLDG